MSDRSVRAWQPTRFIRFVSALDTSMETAEIVTDAGRAYIKALGNRQGPHSLACEWVGTQLAYWFGLPTFRFALLILDDDDEIPLRRSGMAKPGPAFVTRAEKGHVWGGSADELKLLDNPSDLSRLVVFDTWTLNCDRHPPDPTQRKPNHDNVFLSHDDASKGRLRLVAMDHTHCFTCGGNLTERMATIERIKDERIFGLFPGFVPYVREQRSQVQEAVRQLGTFDSQTCRRLVDSIPSEWEVSDASRSALCTMICQRGRFVADSIMDRLAPGCWP